MIIFFSGSHWCFPGTEERWVHSSTYITDYQQSLPLQWLSFLSVVYTRWGRTTCPNITGTQLVYAGRAAGSWWNHKGGGANRLCLPNYPSYLQYTSGSQIERDYLYGSEYQTSDGPLSAFHDHNVPCAVCHVSTRGTVLMIPGKTSCPASWTQEYNGYLMTERHKNHRSMFECVDQNPDTVQGGTGSIDGALFYFVEATCHGIACPPYTAGRELACAVCTKWTHH